ncbi:hypothetical protein T439DRAFT_360824 [Meredithblackwellia eburnea MCA 4105]
MNVDSDMNMSEEDKPSIIINSPSPITPSARPSPAKPRPSNLDLDTTEWSFEDSSLLHQTIESFKIENPGAEIPWSVLALAFPGMGECGLKQAWETLNDGIEEGSGGDSMREIKEEEEAEEKHQLTSSFLRLPTPPSYLTPFLKLEPSRSPPSPPPKFMPQNVGKPKRKRRLPAKATVKWTKDKDELLLGLVQTTRPNWKRIAEELGTSIDGVKRRVNRLKRKEATPCSPSPEPTAYSSTDIFGHFNTQKQLASNIQSSVPSIRVQLPTPPPQSSSPPPAAAVEETSNDTSDSFGGLDDALGAIQNLLDKMESWREE